MKKTCAVIVTYNRKLLLFENIKSLVTQSTKFNEILIVDNHSNDGTEEFIRSKIDLKSDNISFLRLNENIGGAGGFFEGTKYAYEKGYDFVFLMDDDGRPLNNQTFDLIYQKAIQIENENNLIFLNSLVINDKNELSFGLRNISKLDELSTKSKNGIYVGSVNPFNGTLINSKLIKRIGFPNKDFFIKGDENDYQTRAHLAGAFIGTIIESLYFHPSPLKKTVKFLNKLSLIEVDSPWKDYYRVRNYTYTYIISKNIKSIFFLVLLSFKNAYLSNDQIRKRFYFITIGFIHGMRRKLGKRFTP